MPRNRFMDYLHIVRLIMNILFILLGALVFHFALFGIVGAFARKKYPKTDKINRYGLIIPARNEEAVIAGLIQSIQKNEYPQDKLQIFVVAHNCTDKTAEIARSLGATVYEYDNPDECTMGYAFKYLFSCIERDYKTKSFDGFFLFNADNVLDKNYIAKMNDAFEYYNRQSVITSYRNSKNFGKNLISGLYGMYFAVGCRLESRGRTVLGCSTRVQGTGYLINSRLVRKGWPYVTLTEDWEFTADQILYEHNIRYCDEAEFYDEQPTSAKIMWRQRVRWSRGHLLVFYARFKELIAGVFKKKTKHRVSLYDISVNIMPIPLMLFCLQILQFVLEIITPLVDKNYSWSRLILGDSYNLFFSEGMLLNLARSALFSLPFMMLVAIFIFIAERKRIHGVNPFLKILIVLFFPIFMGIQPLIDVQAFFSRHLGWKPIPHDDPTGIDTLDEQTRKEKIGKR